MIELAAMWKLVLYVSLIVCVFAPWSLAISDASVMDRVFSVIVYLAKRTVADVALGLFETSIPRCASSACSISSASP